MPQTAAACGLAGGLVVDFCIVLFNLLPNNATNLIWSNGPDLRTPRLAAAHPGSRCQAGRAPRARSGSWLAEHVDLRDALHRGRADPASVRALALTLRERVAASGRSHPVPVLTERARARAAAEAARAGAIEEQAREAELLGRLQAKRRAAAAAAAERGGDGCALAAEGGLVAVQS